MEIGEGELKVFYTGGLNEVLDETLEDILLDFGYECWASGMEIKSEIRELAFRRINE